MRQFSQNELIESAAGEGLGTTFTVELPLLAEIHSAKKSENRNDINLEYV